MEFLETAIYAVISRTYFYLEKTGRENSFDRFPYLNTLTQRLTQEALDAWHEDGGTQSARYWSLLKRLAGKEGRTDDILRTALDLSLAALHVPEFAGYLNYYTGNFVTIQLAYELEGIPYPDYADMIGRLQKLQYICRVDWTKNPLSYAAIEADNRLLGYLMGADGTNLPFYRKTEWFLPDAKLHPMFIRRELRDQCAGLLMNSENLVLQIAGEGGRRFLAKHTAQSLKKNLLLAEAGHFRDCFDEEAGTFPMELIREAFLHDGAVCIYGIETSLFEKLQISETDFFAEVVLPFTDAGIPLLLCTGENVRFPELIPRMELKETTRKERETVFRGFAGLYDLPIDCTQFSIRYRLSPSQISKAVNRWRNAKNGSGFTVSPADHDESDGCKIHTFSQICCEILCSGQQNRLGTLLYPSVGFSDLKVPEDVQKTLGQICCSVTESYRIFEEWNLKRLYPYGRAVSVLLAGPPGTGKTMTAHVIAKELGMPLYQINLAHVADKYIGETEKHLEQIFSFAEKANLVLFFDEADSLFGKRSEVTEGKDRYANMEVSYILQRIEQFDGIVILATNFYSNIDKAFLRRLKYVLKYRSPDETIRRSIWESCLPSAVPRRELDIAYLAKQFDLTGGMIKNVVWNACVKAVYAGTELTMDHILCAVSEEYEKMEHTVGRDLWGEYGFLMET